MTAECVTCHRARTWRRDQASIRAARSRQPAQVAMPTTWVTRMTALPRPGRVAATAPCGRVPMAGWCRDDSSGFDGPFCTGACGVADGKLRAEPVSPLDDDVDGGGGGGGMPGPDGIRDQAAKIERRAVERIEQPAPDRGLEERHAEAQPEIIAGHGADHAEHDGDDAEHGHDGRGDVDGVEDHLAEREYPADEPPQREQDEADHQQRDCDDADDDGGLQEGGTCTCDSTQPMTARMPLSAIRMSAIQSRMSQPILLPLLPPPPPPQVVIDAVPDAIGVSDGDAAQGTLDDTAHVTV